MKLITSNMLISLLILIFPSKAILRGLSLTSCASGWMSSLLQVTLGLILDINSTNHTNTFMRFFSNSSICSRYFSINLKDIRVISSAESLIDKGVNWRLFSGVDVCNLWLKTCLYHCFFHFRTSCDYICWSNDDVWWYKFESLIVSIPVGFDPLILDSIWVLVNKLLKVVTKFGYL